MCVQTEWEGLVNSEVRVVVVGSVERQMILVVSVGVPTRRQHLLPGFGQCGWLLRTRHLGRGLPVFQKPLLLLHPQLWDLILVEI